jgi:leader peptidase (prepilin peptidase)/N-methyltransferase
VHTLLVAGTAAAGLVLGGVLDPIGQRLADLSQAEDERRLAEQREKAAAAEGRADAEPATDGPADNRRAGDPDAPDHAVGHPLVDVPVTGGPGDPVREPVRHLLPSGRSTGRTAGAATLTGLLFAAAAAHFGSNVVLAPFCAFFAMVVVVSVTDLSHRLVPRRVVYAGLVVIVPLLVATSAVDHRWYSLTGSLIAGAVAFLLFFAVWWFVPRGMGFGDVRLAGVIGVTVGYLSLLHAYVAFLAGFVIGAVFGVVMTVVSSTGRRTRIPFAPSLSAGAVVAVLWGGHLVHGLFHVGS